MLWFVIACLFASLALASCGESIARGAVNGASDVVKEAAEQAKGAAEQGDKGAFSMSGFIQTISIWCVGLGMLATVASVFVRFVVSAPLGNKLIASGLATVALFMVVHQIAPWVEIAVTVGIIALVICAIVLTMSSWHSIKAVILAYRRRVVWKVEEATGQNIDDIPGIGQPRNWSDVPTEALEKK